MDRRSLIRKATAGSVGLVAAIAGVNRAFAADCIAPCYGCTQCVQIDHGTSVSCTIYTYECRSWVGCTGNYCYKDSHSGVCWSTDYCDYIRYQ